MLSSCQRLSGTKQSVLKQKVTSLLRQIGETSRSVLSGEMANIPSFPSEKRWKPWEKKRCISSEDGMSVGAILRWRTNRKKSGCSPRIGALDRTDLGTKEREVRGVIFAPCGELSDTSGIRQGCLVIGQDGF